MTSTTLLQIPFHQTWEVVVLESLESTLHIGVGWLAGVEEEVEEAHVEEVVVEECGVEQAVAQLLPLPLLLDEQLRLPPGD